MDFGKTLRGMLAGTLMLGGVAMASPAVVADDDDDDHFGAYVYAGTPDALDDATVVEKIGELESDDDDDGARAWGLLGGDQDMPDEFFFEDDDFDDDDEVTLDQLLAEPHLIVVHETEDEGSAIVAFGVIEGDVDADGSLLIQLQEHEDSGFEGRAWFGPERLTDDDDDDDDNDELEVIVGIYPAGSVEPLGTPGATT